MGGITKYDTALIDLAEGKLIREGFDSDAGATPAVGAKHENPVSSSLNRSYEQIYKLAAFGGRAS